MRSSFLKAALILTFCTPALAKQIVIEPDDYLAGTDISSISPHVTFATTGGAPVYSSTIHRGNYLAAEGADLGPLGENVFSPSPSGNSEWYYWPEDFPDGGGGLVINFTQPVTSFSFLMAHLYQDAGGIDPFHIDIFDIFENPIEDSCAPHGCRSDFVTIAEWPDYNYPKYGYWTVGYSGSRVSKVIVGGESEPTTIDRLEFSIAQQVPEPGSLALLGLGLAGLGMARRTRRS